MKKTVTVWLWIVEEKGNMRVTLDVQTAPQGSGRRYSVNRIAGGKYSVPKLLKWFAPEELDAIIDKAIHGDDYRAKHQKLGKPDKPAPKLAKPRNKKQRELPI